MNLAMAFITLILVSGDDKVLVNCDRITMIFERDEGSRIVMGRNHHVRVTASPADVEHMCAVEDGVREK